MANNAVETLGQKHPRSGEAPLGLLDSVSEGYQVLDPDLRYLYVNRAAEVHTRRARDALIGRTLLEVDPDVEQTPMFFVLQRCMSQRVRAQMDSEFTYADGTKCWFALKFVPVPEGMLICSEDITARQRDDAERLRSRRVLGVISETNQALVRANDEAEFVRDVCQIAVGRGGYRMAWIGMKEDDEARSIRPVASAGFDDGYTAALNVSWDGSVARGRGPAGRSVRDEAPVVARFLRTEPAYDPWREEAAARGYASAISIPFRVDGEVVGVLVIYSAEPDAFDEHESHLLQELALDLGHGVQGLRARASSQRSAALLARLNASLRTLARVVQTLPSLRDVPSMVNVVCEAARELVGADASAFALRDRDHYVFVGEQSPAPRWRGRRMPLSVGVVGQVIRTRQTTAISDVTQDPLFHGEFEGPPLLLSTAWVPIRRDDPVGAIGVCWATPHTPTDDDLGLLDALAESVAIGLDSLRVVADLTASEDRYRTLVESLEDVVYSVDTSGRFQYVSRSIARFGYTPDELVGRPFTEFVHPEDVGGLLESFARTVQGAAEDRTFRAFGKNGEEHVLRTAGRIMQRDGVASGVTGVMVDLTQLRYTEEQLRAAQKMEAVGQLAGGVAHDFNNLLSVILSYGAFVAEAVRDQPEVSADVDEIVQAAVRGTGLTRQLLAFSRRQVLQPQIVDLNKLAADAEKMLRRLVGEHITLRESLDPGLGKVRADPGQIEQVIMNLVVNARDAMPHGGTITLETSNVDLEHDLVGEYCLVPAGRYVVLSLKDTGVGMDAATQQHVFEPFFTTKDKGKGTGLGLSTVHGIVAQSGGHICFTSAVGLGTTFLIYFPRVDDEGPGPEILEPTAVRASEHETILLVEDDRALRAIVERTLRDAGYCVLTAEDGEDALRVAEAERRPIDLLLTDVIMPNLNGSQLAQRLVAVRPTLRVVYMSGYTDNVLAEHGVLEPGTWLITKPFSSEDLLRRLRAALDAREST